MSSFSPTKVADARQAWTNCMKALGYDYIGDQDQIIADYQQRLERLLDGQEPAALTGERAAALKKLQSDGIGVSLADLAGQLNYTDEVYNQVEPEMCGYPLN